MKQKSREQQMTNEQHIKDVFSDIASDLADKLKQKGFIPGKINMTIDAIESMQCCIDQYIAGLDPNKLEMFDIHIEEKGSSVYIHFTPLE